MLSLSPGAARGVWELTKFTIQAWIMLLAAAFPINLETL